MPEELPSASVGLCLRYMIQKPYLAYGSIVLVITKKPPTVAPDSAPIWMLLQIGGSFFWVSLQGSVLGPRIVEISMELLDGIQLPSDGP